MGATGAFRVGDDVALKGVLMYLSLLILIFACVEIVLHRIERRAEQEILGKIYRGEDDHHDALHHCFSFG